MKTEKPLNDLGWTVERPVVLDVLKDLIDLTQISTQTPISFYGYDGKSYQKGSTIEEAGIAGNKWNYDERVYLEVDEDYEENWAQMTPVFKTEYPPIFFDGSVGVVIRPVYRYTKVTLNIRYRTVDKNQALRWRSEMATKCSMRREIIEHDIHYSYTLNPEWLVFIKHVHDLRENVAGYGQTLNDYFTAHLVSNAGLVTDLAGKNGVWAVSEAQTRIQGSFEFDSAPQKVSREDDHDNWMAEVSYTFYYMKPMATTLEYPASIHQQLISSQFLPKDPILDLEDKPVHYSRSGAALRRFESSHKLLSVIGMEGVKTPLFDSWVPRHVKPTTINLMTSLVTITPDDKRFLFNLKDLGSFKLMDDVLSFIQNSERTFITKNYQSIFQIDLYDGQDIQTHTALTVDQNLNVSTTYDLDLRKVYHIRISLCTTFRYLPAAAITRLQNAPSVAMKFITAINAAIKSLAGSRSDIESNVVSDINKILLTGKLLDAQYGRGFDLMYIASMFVQVYGKNLAPIPAVLTA